ncbi:MAG TPA: beta-propeller fold lactonase family protein [Candidatus Binataceae bacterium]|nr:beta-propeller fold lactonase family protein [Candidatus Binataceae bacterium]
MRRAARTAPACLSLAIIAALAAACGRSIFPSADTSPTPTATPTPATSALLYSTNFDGGTISQFKRNQDSGALAANGVANAGSKSGPFGITANNNFVYVANTLDGVYQYKINQSSGKLSAIGGNSGLVGAGRGSQWVALTPNGSFAYVMNFGDGSISQYTVQSNGALTANGVTTGLTSPYAAVATGSFLYVTDEGAGTVVSFPINNDGTLGAPTSTRTSGGSSSPGPIVIYPSGQFVYVGDLAGDFVTQLKVISTGLQFVNVYSGLAVSSAVGGLAIAEPNSSSGNFFLYGSNQTPGTLSIYVGSTTTGVLSTVAMAANGLSGPAGITIDGTNSFLYVANSTANTITRFNISASNGALSNPAARATGDTPENAAIP